MPVNLCKGLLVLTLEKWLSCKISQASVLQDPCLWETCQARLRQSLGWLIRNSTHEWMCCPCADC